ncbi:MAG: peptide chain release factor 1 [Planctomycetota bacterium]|nr:MAG: peptide chain release factor 1 [Planctomycetota bacterium]
MFDRLRQHALRFRELQDQLEDPELHAKPAQLAAVVREMGALRDKAESWDRWEALQAQRASAEALLAESDAEMRAMAREELAALDSEQERMAEALRLAMVDIDPNRGRAVIVEVRAGTGGDEASLFVGDLVKIYTRFAESRGLKLELLSSHPTEVGGYKELSFGLAGPEAWDLFRFESGGHRVQRVPETESAGRIHTSAVTVAVLAEAEELEIDIDDGDLRIDTYRASGPGGQNVNKTSSAVRITHLPTNTVVQCQDESSQHKNKARALRMLRARIADAQAQARKQAEDAERRVQIGSGDRSERIRTYNWPQNRVTDHRLKNNYSLDKVLLGQLDQIVQDLRDRDLELKLAALSDGAEPS